jgi:Family of unknown function (DUF5677)
MHSFAREDERSSLVQANLADHFDFAEALFNFWLDQGKNRWDHTVPIESANLALILDVQACRLFRSVIEDCRRCEAFNASIFARTLFETVLAVAFLLNKDVRIIVEAVVDKCGVPGALPRKFAAKFRSPRTKRTRKHLLSREFRANLFLAFDYFQLQGRAVASLAKFPGLHQKAKSLRKLIDPNIAAQYEQDVGPQWLYILRHGRKGYAGLSVEDLSKALGKQFSLWYQTMYHFQSTAVHALDFRKHLDRSDTNVLKASYLSPESQILECLRAATAMFFTNMHIMQRNIGFGPEVDMAFASLMRKFGRLRTNGK